jgi:uncharacterized membrane protein
MTADTWTAECGPRTRFWIVPVAILGTLVAVGVGVLILAWAGLFSPPPSGGAYPPFWFVFPLGFVLFWVIVVVVVRPWRRQNGWGWGRGWQPYIEAGEMVRIRFARGEISKDQMTSLLRDLDETSPPMRREQAP